jgi:hypothetical protein
MFGQIKTHVFMLSDNRNVLYFCTNVNMELTMKPGTKKSKLNTFTIVKF